jgi:transposase
MNELKVHERESILSLWKGGWSARRIARELGCNRETVGRYIRLEAVPKPATPTPGNEGGSGSVSEGKPATLTPGNDEGGEAKPATPTPGIAAVTVATACEAAQRNLSLCAAWKAEIEAGLEQGLTAKRIHQDLAHDRGFAGSYQSVKRFVRKLEEEAPVPYRRMNFAPGEQVQVDFGTGHWIVTEDGKQRRVHVFRAVLCHSRKGYSEATYDQKTETFLRCLENAYRHFGGVPITTAPDNLKAAVLHPDWYDPELNPKAACFAKHYDSVLLPTKPRTPRHKGRVENGVGFTKEALRGRSFASLTALNAWLLEWETSVADNRIHGTTRRHVGRHFLEVEKPALKPLPAMLFPSFTEGRRSVHLDGHVEFEKAYYSVPPEYTRREVWVRGESKLIRIFSLKMEPVAVHPRVEPGLAHTENEHIHPLKRRLADHGTAYLLERCRNIGPAAGAWAEAVYRHRPIESIRVMQGLIALARRSSPEEVERGAGKALQRAGWRLGDVRRALAEGPNVVQADFLERHPLIRDMDVYRIPFPS